MDTVKNAAGVANVAIRVLHLRRDGFVFVEAPWVALEGCAGWCHITQMPFVVTADLAMPSCAAPVESGVTQNGTASVCGKDTVDTRIGTGGYTHIACNNDTDCPVSGCYSTPITCNKADWKPGFVGVCSAKGFDDGGALYQRPAQALLTGGVEVLLNVETASDGFVATEVQDAATGTAVKGFALSDADLLTGNFVAHAASWHNGVTAINGKAEDGTAARSKVRVRLALNNARLFSVELRCTEKK